MIQIIAACSLLAVFAAATATIKWLDIPYSGLDISGGHLVAYHLARVACLVCLFIACLTTGALAIRFVAKEATPTSMGWCGYLACSGYLGLISLALVSVMLGAVHLYYTFIAFSLVVPLLALAPWMLAEAVVEAWNCLVSFFKRETISTCLLRVALIVAVVVAASSALAIKVLFYDASQGDLWGHYYHYAYLVIQNHGLAPNDVWYHFYLSKGAGLTFLTILLTDLLQPQLVSALYLTVAVMAFGDLLRRVTNDACWALTGAAIMLFYFGTREDAPCGAGVCSFGKHHIAMSSLLLLLVWAPLMATSTSGACKRAYLCTAGLGMFYLPILVPIGLVFALVSLIVLLAVGFCIKVGSGLIKPVAAMATAGIAGLSIIFACNYVVTGLLECAPARLWWDLVNYERFEAHWSRYCMEYFVSQVEDVGAREISALDFFAFHSQWAYTLSRKRYFAIVLLVVTAICAIIARIRSLPLNDGPKVVTRGFLSQVPFLITIASILVALLMIAQPMPSAGSIERLYVFVGAHVILIAITLWSWLLTPTSGSNTWWQAIPMFVAITITGQNSLKEFTREHGKFILGKCSLRVLVNRAEKRSRSPMCMEHFLEARRHLGPEDRMMTFVYIGGPGYVLGGPPVMADPTWSFGRHYDKLLFGSPEEGLDALKQSGCTHVAFHLEGLLFVGAPYSPLFEAANLRRHFRLCMRDKNFFLLTWKNDPGTKPLPDDLLQIMELKQHGVFDFPLHGPLGKELEREIEGALLRRRDTASTGSQVLEEDAAECIALLEQKLKSGVRLPENHELMTRTLAMCRQNLSRSNAPKSAACDLTLEFRKEWIVETIRRTFAIQRAVIFCDQSKTLDLAHSGWYPTDLGQHYRIMFARHQNAAKVLEKHRK